MKTKLISMAFALVVAAGATACSTTSESEQRAAATVKTSQSQPPTVRVPQTSTNNAAAPPAAHAPARDDHHGHSHGAEGRVPAFETDKASLKKLPPTLAPEKFAGRQKLAYQAVKEIPETIAQLPCYCYCDEGFGHKSLHTCFVDDHAAHCAVCVDEALLAYELQKQQRFTPEQIRERVIAQFSH